MLNCERLRAAVIASALLLGLGVILGTIAETTPWPVPTSHFALFSVLGAAALLAATFLASLLPGTARRLSECRH
jgi:hypothetical protein